MTTTEHPLADLLVGSESQTIPESLDAICDALGAIGISKEFQSGRNLADALHVIAGAIQGLQDSVDGLHRTIAERQPR